MGETTVRDYIQRSKLTGAGRNGIQGAAEFWDYLAAHQELSIFWTFVSKEFYFARNRLSTYCSLAIPFVNVWFFFVRKNYFPECWSNLLNTFSKTIPGVNTHEKTRRTIEVLIVQYLCGISLMPGAHGQFQFWFTALVPILLGMIGLPACFTFLVTPYLYPIKDDPCYQHYMLLSVCAWLLTVGPCDDLIQWTLHKLTQKEEDSQEKVEEENDKKNK